MTKTLTPHMLRSKLKNVASPEKTSNTQNNTKTTGQTTINTKKIKQLKGTTIILDDGKKAQILLPIPGMTLRATSNLESDGGYTLRKNIKATILETDTTNYCLGISGDTDELTLKIDMGESEIEINNLYTNIKTPHIVCNGVELRKEND